MQAAGLPGSRIVGVGMMVLGPGLIALSSAVGLGLLLFVVLVGIGLASAGGALVGRGRTVGHAPPGAILALTLAAAVVGVFVGLRSVE